jgi:hypothetical protein
LSFALIYAGEPLPDVHGVRCVNYSSAHTLLATDLSAQARVVGSSPHQVPYEPTTAKNNTLF